MIIAEHANSKSDANINIVAIFGLGLIGTSVLDALCPHHSSDKVLLDFNWTNQAQQHQDIQNILLALKQKATKHHYKSQLNIVWSAGRQGFEGTSNDLEKENEVLIIILDLLKDIAGFHWFTAIKLHLISSAGGLFEGQRLVDHNSKVHTTKPYGRAKLLQEQAALEIKEIHSTYLYRPSTVFGYAGRNCRKGLILTLIDNMFNNKVTTIFGRADTLRDYVLSNDVGRFIAHNCQTSCSSRHNDQTFILASGKPTSIAEIIYLMEEIFQRKLMVRYELSSNNILSNTFRPSNHGGFWTPTELKQGLTSTLLKYMFSREGEMRNI